MTAYQRHRGETGSDVTPVFFYNIYEKSVKLAGEAEMETVCSDFVDCP